MLYENASVSERRTMPPAVAVSTVAFALRPPEGSLIGDASRADDAQTSRAITLWLPLVRRTRAPFRGRWALPGGPTRWDETLSDTALRTLRAAVLRDPGYLEQLYSFGGVERSAEAQRLVTIAYWALYGESDLAESPSPIPEHGAAVQNGDRSRRWDDPDPPSPAASPAPGDTALGNTAPGDPASGDPAPGDPDPNVAWFSADRLPELAFDHAEIVAYALARLRSKTEYEALAHRFLGSTFTLTRLRAVTEAVLGETVDPANFRRQALAQGNLVDTGEVETGGRHRPARLYRFRGSPSSGHPEHSDRLAGPRGPVKPIQPGARALPDEPLPRSAS
ncbi:NUDIX hydrolase [Leucobacter tenebrionis]|uniref:NUDIX hydrolase n=1 Tax=Leucobacter tenebrionis TaxID=2873270 RepID=UPI001CA712BA|nr:NUDIX domain-containing protein [Leucobacter tenebrionis]QZY51543.1 hypothetical protein KVY00_13405 [Leucobacter tenebrionis]